MSTNSSVAILGAGPSGLVAAHSAMMAGHDVHIYTKPDGNGNPAKSALYGCQYLHAPIPGIDVSKAIVDYRLQGESTDYRRKVYGPESTVDVSPETLTGQHLAWNIRQTYDLMWMAHMDMGFSRVFPQSVGPEDLPGLIRSYTAVISTLPAPSVCSHRSAHDFESSRVWAIGDAPNLGIWAPVEVEANTVVCSGDRRIRWYRAANVFGYTTVEWPDRYLDLPPSAVPVRKPIKTNCDCWPEVLRAGRFAEWTKGVLVHETYDKVKEFLYATKSK